MKKLVCYMLALAAIAAMSGCGKMPHRKTEGRPAQDPTTPAAWQQTVPEYYNGHEVVRWVDAYSVILRINGEEVGVSLLPEPSNWDPIVDWDAFDQMALG